MIEIKQIRNLQAELSKIQPYKVIIPAAAMLPMTDASAYYLEGDIPSMVFSHLSNTSIKAQLWDYEIPPGVTKIRARVMGVTDIEKQDIVKAIFIIDALWVGEGVSSITFNPSNEFEIEGNNELTYSTQSQSLTISGTRTTGCGLWVNLKRNALSEDDDLNQSLMVAWLEIEFE